MVFKEEQILRRGAGGIYVAAGEKYLLQRAVLVDAVPAVIPDCRRASGDGFLPELCAVGAVYERERGSCIQRHRLGKVEHVVAYAAQSACTCRDKPPLGVIAVRGRAVGSHAVALERVDGARTVARPGSHIAVLVVACHLLRETVGVAADTCSFPVSGGGQPVQSVISELIASRRALVAGFPRHAADVPVVTGIGPVRILQSLRELGSADARHPVAYVVAVVQLVGGCTVRGFAL